MDERISYDNVSMLSESKRKLLEDYVKEKGETLINVLGSRYLKRGLAGKRTRTVLVLTDKHLYQEGVLMERIHGTLPRIHNRRNKIPVENIKSTTYGTRYPLTMLIVCLIFVIVSLIVYRFLRSYTPLTILLAVISALAYTFSKRALLLIEHTEGNICLDVKWYSKEEVFNFRETLYIMKKDVYSESSSDPDFVKI
ncbi:MAG: hypothetical protein ACOX3Q_00270 [Clostridia bacterium]|jgi:hypothetical protein|nr:MFS transporter [Clostridiaceae bacterium]